jgi:hypothetical protein
LNTIFSWQTSLASSAVLAAEDVRAAVRASRTALNARATASSAALSAQQACKKGEFSSIDDARAAQTRASIAQQERSSSYTFFFNGESRRLNINSAIKY